jgi:hypothetical protein
MRTALGCALALAFVVPLACGGGAAESGAAKSPGPTGSSSVSDAGAATTPDTPPTTTTVTLADGGDLQGAKLTETRTVAATSPPSASSASSPPPKGPHAHEPGRGPEDIRAIVMAHRDEARACYDSGLKDHPGIEGDLVIAWTIDPKGNVTQAGLDTSRSQIVEPTVVACTATIIKNIQFAASPGGFETKAFYPFNFHPHHGTATHAP